MDERLDVASALLEWVSQPALVLLEDGRVWDLNGAMQSLLGLDRVKTSGMDVTELCQPLGPARALTDALRRGAEEGGQEEVELWAASGRVLRVELATTPTTVDGRPAILVVVHEDPHQGEDDEGTRDLHYEVSVRPDSRGRLLRVVDVGGESLPLLGDERCYERLGGREEPCPGCPLFRAEGPLPEAARFVMPASSATRSIRVVTVRRLSQESYALHQCDVRPPLLGDLIRARLCQLADGGGLSPRERNVLRELLEGKRLEDIGARLGIGARTVKFHQANVLRKLGVPSRHALFRLLL